MFERHDQVSAPLYVVCAIFNPIRFRSRWKLYEDFVRQCEAAGAILYTAEVAFGSRAFVLTDKDNPHHLQLRTSHELWLKENVLNLLIQRLPADWKYVAWVDADVTFARSDWANETVHQLQHYDVVQMWSEAQDLSPTHEILDRFRSFVWCWQNNVQTPKLGDDYYYAQKKSGTWYYHPGYAWAFRRSALDALGGLMDWAILGGGDTYMARALTGIQKTLPASLGATGRRWLKIWEDRADTYVRRNVGLVDGLVLHHWHGKKSVRGYKDRGQIMVDAKFDPDFDLKRDSQGLYQLTDRSQTLRDGLRAYFRARNEDGIDI